MSTRSTLQNGIANSLPSVVDLIGSLIFCNLADWLITRKHLSATTTRKMMEAFREKHLLYIIAKIQNLFPLQLNMIMFPANTKHLYNICTTWAQRL